MRLLVGDFDSSSLTLGLNHLACRSTWNGLSGWLSRPGHEGDESKPLQLRLGSNIRRSTWNATSPDAGHDFPG